MVKTPSKYFKKRETLIKITLRRLSKELLILFFVSLEFRRAIGNLNFGNLSLTPKTLAVKVALP